jgi:hypothetical protein
MLLERTQKWFGQAHQLETSGSRYLLFTSGVDNAKPFLACTPEIASKIK